MTQQQFTVLTCVTVATINNELRYFSDSGARCPKHPRARIMQVIKVAHFVQTAARKLVVLLTGVLILHYASLVLKMLSEKEESFVLRAGQSTMSILTGFESVRHAGRGRQARDGNVLVVSVQLLLLIRNRRHE